LDYAHRHGVIHRDIKPENILLHDDTALVADFGIALAVSSAGGTRMTETGLSLGTPHYMSPEQSMGEREITARSDVYALGCVTYEMLTGDPAVHRFHRAGHRGQGDDREAGLDPPASRAGSSAGRRRGAYRAGEAARRPLRECGRVCPGDHQRAGGRLASEESVPRRDAAEPVPPASRLYAASAAILLLAVVGRDVRGRPEDRPAGDGVAAFSTRDPGAELWEGPVSHRCFDSSRSPETARRVVLRDPEPHGKQSLAFQRVDATGPSEIEGSQFMLNPQISPDGRWLIGWAAALSGSDRAYRIPVSGGTPEPLPLEVRSQQAAWDSKGNFWFTQTPGGRGIARLTPDGKVGAELAAKTVGLLLQQILPVTSMP
jgi:serine/threonine-protein kinase